MSEAQKQQEWDSGVYGLFWAHTVYGGDDLDSMMQCTIDSPKAQTVGVRVQLPDGGVDFHMNCDRLGYVDWKDGEKAYNLNVQAAYLFVAAPDLLDAAREAVKEGQEWFDDDKADYAAADCVDRMMTVLQSAIEKAEGGE